MRKFLKTWMLPISMVGGVLFHNWIGYIRFLTPYLIFTMLFLTFLRISPREMRITRFHWLLLSVQVVGGWIAYFVALPFGHVVAQGVMICVLISTATSAPVITGMLGGSVSRLASYSLMSNMAFAFFSPLFLSVVNDTASITFADSFYKICAEVLPLILVPFAVALLLCYRVPGLHSSLLRFQSVSFYLWAIALFIVVGNSVCFIINQPVKDWWNMIWLSLGAFLVCCAQFYVGRRIGAHYGDKVAGAQGLGQKNTILAIWVSITYLNPLASVAPAAYVAWQNIINSVQLYFKQRK